MIHNSTAPMLRSWPNIQLSGGFVPNSYCDCTWQYQPGDLLTRVWDVGPDEVWVTQVGRNTVGCEESPGEQEGCDLVNNDGQSQNSEVELRTYQGQILRIR